MFRKNQPKSANAPILAAGTPAPEFSLEDAHGEKITLNQYRGQPVILAFYPEDDTPVCSNQLALYNEALHLFDDYEAQLLAISVDDADSHRQFVESLKLRFPLLADDDPAGEVAKLYRVFNPGDGKSDRSLFVIDQAGMIQWSELSPRGVNPGAHGILQALESLR